MYFLTYKYKNIEHIGVLNKKQNKICNIEEFFQKLGKTSPKNMIELIETLSDDDINSIEKSILNFKDCIELEKAEILAPIPYPKRNIICLGKNYMEHISEVKNLKNVWSDIPSKPIYFSKIASPAIGHMDKIDSHSDIVKELDYEVEFAVIIGKKCKNVKKSVAENYIFGYSIANDISARDIQTNHVQWFKGKSFDTFCPMGPYIVNKKSIPYPPQLEIKSYVNKELRQDGNTNQLIFDISTIISDISAGITLHPGDIILTGTPAGVGAGFNPPKYLKSGDIIECSIQNIGTLINIVE